MARWLANDPSAGLIAWVQRMTVPSLPQRTLENWETEDGEDGSYE